ncbi:hypothetical protein [Methylobacterium aerolatum]|uniref:Uncharacterized protein n=1 Tax=Methylobacterium aerolatum TaxID=418708 RepID=A0ABU0I3B1_9HYPH|nr:hypothetical protein [Methylobacterium aerolatum]MDQ0449094.1 hypothetical protein [Methylobacterium aerolatum]GJD35282.1 hypothetical protein FMGBMHLM_2191 [Methylobacterium aerolatum]
MDTVYTAEERRLLVSSLRLLFDALVRQPTDDPLKHQSRESLRRILSLLEGEGARLPPS